MDSKPVGHTHLFDNHSLVHKSHGVIRFRGKLDLLQAYTIEAAVAARQEGHLDVAAELSEVLQYLRNVMGAEVTGRPMPELSVAGFSAEELHRVSHDTTHFLNVGWVLPDPAMGMTVSKLNLLRAFSRDVELSAVDHLADADHLSADNRERLFHGLNRLSNIVYVLVCKVVGRMTAG